VVFRKQLYSIWTFGFTFILAFFASSIIFFRLWRNSWLASWQGDCPCFCDFSSHHHGFGATFSTHEHCVSLHSLLSKSQAKILSTFKSSAFIGRHVSLIYHTIPPCMERVLCSCCTKYWRCSIIYHFPWNCMYVCVRGGPNQPLHRDPQWSIVLPLLWLSP
jgi:hypothetical protein